MVKQARPDELTGSSRDLDSVVSEFKTELRRLQTDMENAGQPFGGDLLGMVIGETHAIGMESIFRLYGDLGDVLGDDAEDLGRLADLHRKAESKSNERVSAVGDELV